VRHYEKRRSLKAKPALLFAWLDDQTRLAAHMGQSSMMMGGGSMTYEFDSGQGRAVGSHIKMLGSAFGLHLFVDEVVVRRDPPVLKQWRTVGHPRLLIIGSYEMGFAITPADAESQLRIWIDYELPQRPFARLLGFIFAPLYARWCVARMIKDAAATSKGPSTVPA